MIGLGLEVFAAAIGRLPERWGDRLCWWWARGIGWWFAGRRAVVAQNLRAAWPSGAPVAPDDVFHHLAGVAWDFIRLDRHLSTGFTRIATESVLGEAAALGRGVVVVTGHLGSWELVAAALAHRVSVRTHLVVKPLGALDEWVQRRRRQFGLQTIVAGRGVATVRPALRALRAGEIVVVVIDQHAPTTACVVPFFGRPAATTVLPAWLAQQADAPMIWLSTWRAPDRTHGVQTVRLDAVDLDHPAARRVRMVELTRRLEASVRAHPAQWLWTHRRWKVNTRACVRAGDEC